MLFSKGILAQIKPSSGVLTQAYKGPVGRSANINSIVVCNQSSVDTSFRISVAPGDAADNAAQYFFYDTAICGNETKPSSLSLPINTGDVVRVYSLSGTLSFNIWGVEIP